MTVITSSQNAKIQLVRALLGRAKERREAGAFVVEGVRLVEEAETIGWNFRFALYDDSLNERGSSLVEHLLSRGVEVEEVSERLMKSLSDTETPQGILAVLTDYRLPIHQISSSSLTKFAILATSAHCFERRRRQECKLFSYLLKRQMPSPQKSSVPEWARTFGCRSSP